MPLRSTRVVGVMSNILKNAFQFFHQMLKFLIYILFAFLWDAPRVVGCPSVEGMSHEAVD